jgi:hypothetical protein
MNGKPNGLREVKGYIPWEMLIGLVEDQVVKNLEVEGQEHHP